jgi:hypothetical protein
VASGPSRPAGLTVGRPALGRPQPRAGWLAVPAALDLLRGLHFHSAFPVFHPLTHLSTSSSLPPPIGRAPWAWNPWAWTPRRAGRPALLGPPSAPGRLAGPPCCFGPAARPALPLLSCYTPTHPPLHIILPPSFHRSRPMGLDPTSHISFVHAPHRVRWRFGRRITRRVLVDAWGRTGGRCWYCWLYIFL